MPALGKLSATIQTLYQAGAGEQPWDGVGSMIARLFETESAALFVRDAQIRDTQAGPVDFLSLTSNFTPDFNARYRAHDYQYDEWAKRGLGSAHLGRVIGSDDIITDEEMLRSEHYRLWGTTLDMFYVVGSVFSLDQHGKVGCIGIHNRRRRGLFNDRDKRRLTTLLPHLRQAYRLHLKMKGLAITSGMGLAALESLSIGAMVTDEERNILFANPVAQRLFASSDGLQVRNGRLFLKSSERDQEFSAVVSGAARSATGDSLQPGGTVAVQRANGLPFLLSVYPLAGDVASLAGGRNGALIFVSDPEASPLISADAVAKLYHLTRAEARLTKALAEGLRLQEYADQMGISIHTVKSELKHIFEKTGHERQSDLVRDVLNNPVIKMIGN